MANWIVPAARLLRLLSLLQSRREWTGPELAQRLEVTVRTLRRDVERLRGLGYPVDATRGSAGGYRLGVGGALPPLLLDDEEAVAVAVGLRAAATGTFTGMAETSVRALAKLERVLPARLRQRVEAIQAATVPLVDQTSTVDAKVLVDIAAACRDLHRLGFTYRDGAGKVSARTVEPHRLVHTGRRWYLVARDVHRNAWRTLRVDRIDGPLSTGPRFTPSDPPDAATFVASAVSAGPYRYRAHVLLHAPASAITARVSPTSGTVEPVDAGTCVLTAGSQSLDAIAIHLAALGVDFEILAPAELADRIHALGQRFLRSRSRDQH